LLASAGDNSDHAASYWRLLILAGTIERRKERKQFCAFSGHTDTAKS
jgi:hypothetical protein